MDNAPDLGQDNAKALPLTKRKPAKRTIRRLRPLQAAFVTEYLKDGNARQAAIRAGYKPTSASTLGSRLLANPLVSAKIERAQAKTEAKAALSIERLDEEIRRIATLDPRRYYNPDGTLKSIVDLDDDTAAALSSVETIEKIIKGKRGRTRSTIKKLKTWDKIAAIQLGYRRLGALQDNVNVKGTFSLDALVKIALDARDREAKQIEGTAEVVSVDEAPSNGQDGK